MKTKSIVFYKYQLNFNKEIKDIPLDTTSNHRHNSITYSINYKNHDNMFWCIEVEYGSPKPRPETVIHEKRLDSIANPRNEEYFEPKKSYALVNITKKQMYISNISHKRTIINFLQKLTKVQMNSSAIYSEEEFIEKISSIKNMTFVVQDDINSSNTELSKILDDEHYSGAIDKAILKIKFKRNTKIIPLLKRKIGEIIHDKFLYRNIVIQGKGLLDEELIFNSSEVQNKIQIFVDVDTNGNILSDDLFDKLQKEIKHE